MPQQWGRPASAERSKFLVQPGHRPDAAAELFQSDPLVRRVSVFAGKPEPDQKDVRVRRLRRVVGAEKSVYDQANPGVVRPTGMAAS